MTGGLVVVLIAMLGGAALVGGASAIIGRDLGAPAGQAPDEEPILVVEPTATATEGAETPTAERPDSTEPPAPPEPNQRDAVEATVAPDLDGSTHEPAASGETDETDEPDWTHDGDEDGADDQEETDEPEGDDSSGGFGEDAGGGLPEEPGGSSAS
jgi:type IV secretory pathway VirB10-like protein